MPREHPETLLRRIFRARTPADAPPPAALEARVLAEHARLHGRARRAGLWGFAFAHRWALLGGLAAIGACRLPVDYERRFGATVECKVPRPFDARGDLDGALASMRESIAVESLAVRVADEGGDRIAVHVDAWGDLEAPEELLERLREAVPGLGDAECSASPLAGTVHGTLGGRLGLSLLHVDLDRRDAAAARQQILEELARQGFEGTAEVEVSDDDDGNRRVRIELQQVREAPAPAGDDG